MAASVEIAARPEGPHAVDQKIQVWAIVRSDNVATDPTECSIMHRDPSGNEATEIYNGGAGNVQKSSTGRFYLALDLDEEGTWYLRVKTTGTVAAAETSVIVNASGFDSP